MHKNLHSPVIKAAVAQAQNTILGASGSAGGSPAPLPTSLTQIAPNGVPRHRFMIGVDAIGDPEAAFLADGESYDFGN